MPLKEKIIPFIDEISPPSTLIGSINTLILQENKWFGTNTDGTGALNAIEKVCIVKNKKIVLLGAGGVAKAIAYEAALRGAKLTIINRNFDRAIELANISKGHARPWEDMNLCSREGYDILINSTPCSMPIAMKDILPNVLIMDVKTKPKVSGFLKASIEQENSVVYGYQMFIEQAIGQFEYWFKENFNAKDGRELLQKVTLASI